MNQTLLFRFTDTDYTEWLPPGGPRHGTLTELTVFARGRRLVLVAPGETVTLTRARIPGRNRATRLKALPYALEEGLAEEVESLHFAMVNLAEDEVPVAVVTRQRLSGWLARCHEAGLEVSAIVPEPLLLPFSEGIWSLLVESDRAVVRCGYWNGFATKLEELPLLLGLALEETAPGAMPQRLRCWGELPAGLAKLDLETETRPAPRSPLQLFAAGLADALALNLLQGVRNPRTQLAQWLRPWRAAAALIGIWLGLQLALQVTEYWQLRRQHSLLQAEMERVYRETVPSARRIVNPRAQLENHLRELQGDDGGQPATFLELLYRGGGVLADFPSIRLLGLRYQDNQLDFELEGDSLETLDRLEQRLAERPDLEAQIRTTKREDRIESLVSLRSPIS